MKNHHAFSVLLLLSSLASGLCGEDPKVQSTNSPPGRSRTPQELIDFANTEVKPIIEGLAKDRLPYLEICARFRDTVDVVHRCTGHRLGFAVLPQYCPLSKEIMSLVTDGTNGAPMVVVFLPAIADFYDVMKQVGRPRWRELFQSDLIVATMHSMEGARQCPRTKDRQEQVDSEAWANTCRYTLDPLYQRYRVPLTPKAFYIYRAWILSGGGDESFSCWTNAMQRMKQTNDMFMKAVKLREQARRSQGPEAERALAASAIACRDALEVHTRKGSPQIWAQTKVLLADVLREQARLSHGVEAGRLLADSAAALREALGVYTRGQHWARVQINLASVLRSQANLSKGPEASHFRDESIATCRAVLRVFAREKNPGQWAAAQMSLSLALQDQARHSQELEAAPLLAQSIEAIQAAMEVIKRTQSPKDWAMMQCILGCALAQQARHAQGAEKIRLLKDSEGAFRTSLEICTPADFPRLNKGVSNLLARVEQRLKEAKQ